MEKNKNNIVQIHYNRVSNVSSTESYSNENDGSDKWSLKKFKENFKILNLNIEDKEVTFDLINIDTSLSNSFRRIMLSEVPCVAVKSIFVFMNTSVIHDEILAQRIGLIPLKIDPDLLSWVDEKEDEFTRYNEENCVIFSLNKVCTRNLKAPKDSTDPKILYNNSNVYAKDLIFEPIGNQSEKFKNQKIHPVDPDILIAKLRPGQEISLKALCILGVGSDHAKFSPVSTAFYRLLPQIEITSPIVGESAKKFQKCFSPGVISINSKNEAYVLDARNDKCSREVLRHDEFKNKVKLGRIKNHFLFSIESTGSMPAEEIFFKSVRILKNKAEFLKNCPIKQ